MSSYKWSNYVMNAVIVQPLSLIVINNGCYLFTFDKNCENYNLGTSTCDNKNTKYSWVHHYKLRLINIFLIRFLHIILTFFSYFNISCVLYLKFWRQFIKLITYWSFFVNHIELVFLNRFPYLINIVTLEECALKKMCVCILLVLCTSYKRPNHQVMNQFALIIISVNNCSWYYFLF